MERIYCKLKNDPAGPNSDQYHSRHVKSCAEGQEIWRSEAKIIFVRDRHRKDWLALLTTDINLSDEKVVRIYGKRWAIEFFFRMSKQHLGLKKGIQTREFDSQIAYASLVMVRYMFLAFEQRRQSDQRTLGSLFRACCAEKEDLKFTEVLKRIL